MTRKKCIKPARSCWVWLERGTLEAAFFSSVMLSLPSVLEKGNLHTKSDAERGVRRLSGVSERNPTYMASEPATRPNTQSPARYVTQWHRATAMNREGCVRKRTSSGARRRTAASQRLRPPQRCQPAELYTPTARRGERGKSVTAPREKNARPRPVLPRSPTLRDRQVLQRTCVPINARRLTLRISMASWFVPAFGHGCMCLQWMCMTCCTQTY